MKAEELTQKFYDEVTNHMVYTEAEACTKITLEHELERMESLKGYPADHIYNVIENRIDALKVQINKL